MKMALKGLKVIETVGLAPGPLCGTMLADFGASVTVVSKIEPAPFYVMSNGKKMLSLNLKSKEGINVLKKLCSSADVFLDTYRPGVMENLGLGPDTMLKENSKLIYARLTGYGQDGIYKTKAGHDINYVGMSGVLSLLSKNNEPPSPPINILADFAGGSLMCTFGILMALYERSKSGKGQVVDCSMTQGIAYIATWLFKSRSLPIWFAEPGKNLLDGGVPFYATYKTKDNKFMAVGALEPQFYSNFIKALQLPEDEYSQTGDFNKCRQKFQEVFLSKTQLEWCEIFDKTDACVTPVLDLDTVDQNKYHSNGKAYYRDSEDKVLPEAAPMLSRTPGQSVGRMPSSHHGQHSIEILQELGYSHDDIKRLLNEGHIYAKNKSHL